MSRPIIHIRGLLLVNAVLLFFWPLFLLIACKLYGGFISEKLSEERQVVFERFARIEKSLDKVSVALEAPQKDIEAMKGAVSSLETTLKQNQVIIEKKNGRLEIRLMSNEELEALKIR